MIFNKVDTSFGLWVKVTMIYDMIGNEIVPFCLNYSLYMIHYIYLLAHLYRIYHRILRRNSYLMGIRLLSFKIKCLSKMLFFPWKSYFWFWNIRLKVQATQLLFLSMSNRKFFTLIISLFFSSFFKYVSQTYTLVKDCWQSEIDFV